MFVVEVSCPHSSRDRITALSRALASTRRTSRPGSSARVRASRPRVVRSLARARVAAERNGRGRKGDVVINHSFVHAVMAELWEGVYCVSVVFVMFVALLRNVAGPDVLMLGALAMVLAAGISNTGALDYYMGKALGTPKSPADAQLRLMVPIATVSAFLNNTPVVAIMIPIVQKWCRKCKIAPAQLFIPLSFASILGGTCTLIGTSTNLVVDGMRRERYPDETEIGLFELSKYGVPVLLSGLAYMLIAAPFLLPGGASDDDDSGDSDLDNLTVGAVVPRGSPVVDAEVAILRGLNGLYLVSVQRGDSLMRAVRPEFILEVGDVLIFTGLVERIGEVCEKHGLVPLTHDVEEKMLMEEKRRSMDSQRAGGHHPVDGSGDMIGSTTTFPPRVKANADDDKHSSRDDSDVQGLGLLHRAQTGDGLRAGTVDMHKYEHMLRSFMLARDGESESHKAHESPAMAKGAMNPTRRGRASLDFNFRHGDKAKDAGGHDFLSDKESSRGAVEVIRARIMENSPLVGTTPSECKFRHKFKASIMAVQSSDKAGASDGVRMGHLGKTVFQANDILMLHVSPESPLLLQKREREAVAEDRSKRGLPRSASKRTLSADEGEMQVFTAGSDLEVLISGQQTELNYNEFAIPMRVVSGGALDGKTISKVDLANVPGLFCTAIQSSAEGEMRVPEPDTILNGEDIMWFAGDMQGMQTLRRIPGLVSQDDQIDKLNHVRMSDRRLVQAVISQQSKLVGTCVRDTHFRTRYDAVIIAVQRSGGRIQARIGDIVLEAGDVLLLDTSTSFLLDHKADPAFALISEIEDSAPPQFDKLIPSVGTAVVMIAVFVAGALDLFVAALLASGIMMATGCLTQEAARAAVKWEVIVTIAAAFGISAAMEQSGVAAAIASTLVDGGNAIGTGKAGILVAVYVATVILCNIVGNNAAAALMFPIAAGAADKQGIENSQMSFLLMLAASASFMSPFGYQTNLMVYGPGGYVFANFLKFGAPMQVVQLIVSVSVVLLDDKWWIGWVVGFSVVVGIYVVRLVWPHIRRRFVRDASSASSSRSRLDNIQENL